MPFSLQIDGVTIKTPTNYRIEQQIIMDGNSTQRSITGKFSGNGVARKRQLTLDYTTISTADLQVILNNTSESFAANKDVYRTVTITDVLGVTTFNAYFSSFGYSRDNAAVNMDRWRDVTLTFTEV